MKRLLIALCLIIAAIGIIFTVHYHNVKASLPQCWEVEGTEYTGPCEQVNWCNNGVITGD